MPQLRTPYRLGSLVLTIIVMSFAFAVQQADAGSGGPDQPPPRPPGSSVSPSSHGGRPSIAVSRTEIVPGKRGSGSGRVRRRNPVSCRWYQADFGATIAATMGIMGAAGPVTQVATDLLDLSSPAGTTAFKVCINRDTGVTTPGLTAYPGPGRPAAPAITPRMLADQASAQLSVDVPRPATSPGLGRFQLVGMSTWLWLTEWQDVSKTATIPGLSATVSAKPVRTTWDFGAAGSVVCNGPGTPYRADRTSAEQATTCSKTFTQSGLYASSVTVDWGVTWSSSTGQGGTLPGVTRTAAFDVEARAAQAVTD